LEDSTPGGIALSAAALVTENEGAGRSIIASCDERGAVLYRGFQR
jgi:hypothetical protein